MTRMTATISSKPSSMTTISIKEAAILAHLSKQPKESVRKLLTARLGPDAKKLAKTLKSTVKSR
jgi:hypothetical protein